MLRGIACLILASLCLGGDEQRIEALIERFREGSALERQAARAALVRFGPRTWPHFRTLLDDDDPDIRVRARLVWNEILADPGRSWGKPKANTRYDTERGLPLIVTERKSGAALLLLRPGMLRANGRLLELRRPLYFGAYEVTKAQYGRGRPDLLYFFAPDRARLPMADIKLASIQAFLKSTGLRLPTEEEWEYAYHAGGQKTAPAGRKEALPVGRQMNRLGIFDMGGNVAEWCLARDGRPGLLLGGSFESGKRRVTARPDTRGPSIGFRVVRRP